MTDVVREILERVAIRPTAHFEFPPDHRFVIRNLIVFKGYMSQGGTLVPSVDWDLAIYYITPIGRAALALKTPLSNIGFKS